MGWCNATFIFDDVAEFVIFCEEDDEKKFVLLYKLAKALEEQDWDCQSDSNYYDHPIIEKVFQTLHPEWS